MRKLLTLIGICLSSIILMTSSTKQCTIFIIGDSTAANKDIKKGPERGWGMALQGFFTENIRVDNHALNGRSSLSFILEGHWQKVYDAMKPGDYLIIQFGHNDEKGTVGDHKRHTDPGLTLDDNYRMFCRKALAKGATPIVMNAVVRRNFYSKSDQSGEDEALRDKLDFGDEKVNSDTLIDTHGAYIVTPKYVARELRVPYIDANKVTHDLEQGLGIVGSRNLHMWHGVVPGIKEGLKDNTHYNYNGAHIVADLLVDEIARVCPELKPYVRHYDYVVSATGFGNYMSLQDAVDAVPDGKAATISVIDGEFAKPAIPSTKKINIVKYSSVKIN